MPRRSPDTLEKSAEEYLWTGKIDPALHEEIQRVARGVYVSFAGRVQLEAADVAQEVLVKMNGVRLPPSSDARVAALPPLSRVRGYARAVAHSKLLDHLRELRRSGGIEVELHAETETEDAEFPPWATDEAIAKLLGRLRDAEAEAISAVAAAVKSPKTSDAELAIAIGATSKDASLTDRKRATNRVAQAKRRFRQALARFLIQRLTEQVQPELIAALQVWLLGTSAKGRARSLGLEADEWESRERQLLRVLRDVAEKQPQLARWLWLQGRLAKHPGTRQRGQ